MSLSTSRRSVAEIEASSSRDPQERATVLSVEWIDPVMIGGMWMPELVTIAGGTPLVTKPGEHAPTLSKEQLEALDPDRLGQATADSICGEPSWSYTCCARPSLGIVACCRGGRVYVADGNAYFNRPGPRIVESLEILAACVGPEVFWDFAAKHRASVVRIGKGRGYHDPEVRA